MVKMLLTLNGREQEEDFAQANFFESLQNANWL